MAFYCKYCGREEKDLKVLVKDNCTKSPTRYHVAYDGNNINPFVCRHCGREEKDLKVLVKGNCTKSPTRYHEPL